MTILLTGATGYLGGWLLREFLDQGHFVVCTKRSASSLARINAENSKVQFIGIDKSELEAAFAKFRPDVIVHAATCYGRNGEGAQEIVKSNLLFPLSLLETAQNFGTKVFINLDTVLEKDVSSYALSKAQFQDWLLRYSHSMVCCNMALEQFYGPFEDKSKFVSYIISSLLNNVDQIPLTEGLQIRDFVFVKDVVSAISTVLAVAVGFSDGFYQYDVGTGAAVSVRSLVELVKNLTKNTKTQLNFGAVAYRKNEMMVSNPDLSMLLNLGWKPKYSLKEGLLQTIESEQSGDEK